MAKLWTSGAEFGKLELDEKKAHDYEMSAKFLLTMLLQHSNNQVMGYDNNGIWIRTKDAGYMFSIPDSSKPYEWRVEIRPGYDE